MSHEDYSKDFVSRDSRKCLLAERSVPRRDFIKGTAASLATARFGSHNAFAIGRTKSKPNILLIMSDEHNPRITGCYGNKLVQTPTLIRLRSMGSIRKSLL
jgi:hypothetical protein